MKACASRRTIAVGDRIRVPLSDGTIADGVVSSIVLGTQEDEESVPSLPLDRLRWPGDDLDPRRCAVHADYEAGAQRFVNCRVDRFWLPADEPTAIDADRVADAFPTVLAAARDFVDGLRITATREADGRTETLDPEAVRHEVLEAFVAMACAAATGRLPIPAVAADLASFVESFADAQGTIEDVPADAEAFRAELLEQLLAAAVVLASLSRNRPPSAP